MTAAMLEHVNVTVSDPDKTAEILCALFDWKVRWKGDSIHGGHSVHVGGAHSYVALYTRGKAANQSADSYSLRGALNHIGIVVEDLDQAEKRVLDAGYQTHSHADYEPGKRFYFHDRDDIEIEVVSYA